MATNLASGRGSQGCAVQRSQDGPITVDMVTKILEI